MDNDNNETVETETVTVELTISELDLLRQATWSLENKISEELADANSFSNQKANEGDDYYTTRRNTSMTMYFDSKAMRSKLIEASSDTMRFIDSKYDDGQELTVQARKEG